MAQKTLLLCFVLVNAFMGIVLASDHEFYAMAPSPSPSYSGDLPKKLGKHSFVAPQAAKSTGTANEVSSAPVSNIQPNINEENVNLKAREIHLGGHHHSEDKSVAGGGVILGGLATTFLAAIFCYIRATRRQKAETEIITTDPQKTSDFI